MPVVLIPSLVFYQISLVMVYLAVCAMLTAAFGVTGPWFTVLFILLSLTFVSASVATHFHVIKGRSIDAYYTFSAYLFGLMHFLFIGAIIIYGTLNIFYARGIYISPALVGGVVFGVCFLIHLYGTWNSQRPVVKHVKIPFSQLAGFRADFWKGKKIVFISDFQLGNIYKKKFTARVVNMMRPLDPYAVLIGGDLYDGVACDEEALIAPLRELRTPGGMYFITGNHEYYLSDAPRALDVIRAAGITVLDDRKVDLGGIDIIGVDYRTSHKKEDFKKVLDHIGVDRAKPSILLKHEPSDLGVAEAAGVSLDLSGHTHRGQIFPLMFSTRQMYHGFDYGLKKLGDMQVFTSSGVGTWGPPLRLGTKSEIVEIEFI